MLQRHSEAEWDRVGQSEVHWETERGTVRLRVRHGEAQCAAELGQVAPRAINQAQTAAETGTGTGTGAGAGEGAEAAALSALRCMCAFVILLVVLARTHIIKARERERASGREAPKRSKDSQKCTSDARQRFVVIRSKEQA